MSKEKPNDVQRFVRGLIRGLINSNHEPKPQKIAVQPIHQPTKENKRKRNISLTVRMQVLKRDSLKCVYCGRKSPDVSLEVDHIIPFSKGGSNHISNLQTLCFDCNRGKSNRF